MKLSPQVDHGFDWVQARLDCSLENEFVRLKKLVQENCNRRLKSLPPGAPVELSVKEEGENAFSVTRRPASDSHGATYIVSFSLRDDHIHVIDSWANPASCHALTLTLNDKGGCPVPS